MVAGLTVTINGSERTFGNLSSGASVVALIDALGFREDRVAIERNGDILPRSTWPGETIAEQDRLEIVHFVGGGTFQPAASKR